jgi:DNA (cytosine-5)-methyltransferase 1
MSQDITAADHFCGAGGASIGLIRSGVIVTDAANHWNVACDVYGRNNQETRVHCADLSATDPSRFPRTDIGWFSPECRTFSASAPGERVAELLDLIDDGTVPRSRVSMEDVIRFTDHHRYDLVMVENVDEVNRKYPIEWWFSEMEKLGYDYRALSINSMVCWPTPQSRDRWYACFWRKGNRAPDYEVRPTSWCPKCETQVEAYQWFKKPPVGDPRQQHGKYGQRAQYIYKCSRCNTPALPYVWPALSALDLSLPCPRIGDRDTPLAEATMRRIEVGLERYGPAAMVQHGGHTFERPGYYRTWPLWRPTNTMTATNCYGVALAVPLHHSQNGPTAIPLDWAGATQTGRQETGFVVPMRSHADPRCLGEPLAPLTTAHGGGHTVIDFPEDVFIDGGKGKHPASPATWPGQSVTAEGSQFMVTLRNHSQPYLPGADPVPSLTADGNHHGIVDPGGLMVRMNGDLADADTMARHWGEPSGTVTGAGNQAVVPFLTQYYGHSNPGSSGGHDPIPTQTGKDRHAIVEPLSIAVEDCGFRMMEPHEAGAAMAFPADYQVHGSKRTRVKLYGQAVTPPVSALVSARGIESLR